MEPPPGYPPPTLIRKKARKLPKRAILLFLLIFAGLGYGAVNLLLGDEPPAPPPPAPAVERAETEPSGAGDADAAPTALPDTASPEVIVEQPIEEGAAANASDARKANQWYFVSRLGDGPGAIYSRDGGQWNFAFACATRARTIEFIAVNTGSPGDFQGQAINVGTYKLAMDATYSKDGGGMISTVLPANHDFFKALDGSAPMEIQLVADRKTIVPVGPGVVRLISVCRGRA